MLAIERRSQILQILQTDHTALVADLSKLYGVSEETIRRDLEKLEKEGLVKKTYGGAVFNDRTGVDMPLKIREQANKAEKAAIAQKVVSLVEDGDSLMLDSSSTVLVIAKALKQKKRLTVITNSVEVLLELAGHKHISVISTGGTLRDSSLSLAGAVAEKTIGLYNVDKAIISCKGIDLNKAITESNEPEVQVKRAMLGNARKTILAVDSSKFGKVSFTSLAALSEINILATDKTPGPEWKNALYENEITLV